jgi:hypothetical protein
MFHGHDTRYRLTFVRLMSLRPWTTPTPSRLSLSRVGAKPTATPRAGYCAVVLVVFVVVATEGSAAAGGSQSLAGAIGKDAGHGEDGQGAADDFEHIRPLAC